jgi:hypothetical protein
LEVDAMKSRDVKVRNAGLEQALLRSWLSTLFPGPTERTMVFANETLLVRISEPSSDGVIRVSAFQMPSSGPEEVATIEIRAVDPDESMKAWKVGDPWGNRPSSWR